jgi:hypothetical protein
MFSNPGAATDILGLPPPILLIGIAVVLSAIGVAWLRRILRGPEDGDDHWRFRR